MRLWDMRLGDSEQDKKIENILTQHDGFTNATAYVKAAILEYHNRHYLSPPSPSSSEAEKELLDYLMAESMVVLKDTK